jgi:hypothetical protein
MGCREEECFSRTGFLLKKLKARGFSVGGLSADPNDNLLFTINWILKLSVVGGGLRFLRRQPVSNPNSHNSRKAQPPLHANTKRRAHGTEDKSKTVKAHTSLGGLPPAVYANLNRAARPASLELSNGSAQQALTATISTERNRNGYYT